jgi:hypothetical protein
MKGQSETAQPRPLANAGIAPDTGYRTPTTIERGRGGDEENGKSLRHPVFPGGHPSKY